MQTAARSSWAASPAAPGAKRFSHNLFGADRVRQNSKSILIPCRLTALDDFDGDANRTRVATTTFQTDSTLTQYNPAVSRRDR